MQTFDNRKRDTRLPAWRSSEGRFREEASSPEKEGRPHLSGYEPRREEGDKAPRETGRLAGSYGQVSVGIQKQQVVMAVSKRRSRDGEAARLDEQRLHGQSARKLNLARGEFLTNAHDPDRSALLYRESAGKPATFLLNRFREMMDTRQQRTSREQLPFLLRKAEREELRQLESRAVALRASDPQGSREELRAIERRSQELHQILTEKETGERRLRLMLDKAQEQARRQAGTAPLPRTSVLSEGLLPEDQPEDKPENPAENPEGTSTGISEDISRENPDTSQEELLEDNPSSQQDDSGKTPAKSP